MGDPLLVTAAVLLVAIGIALVVVGIRARTSTIDIEALLDRDASAT